MIKRHFAVWIVLAILVAAGQGLLAEQQQEMSPEQAEMMAKWQKFMTPGKEHKRLEMMAGNWKATSKTWEYPGASMTESVATATGEMIMGGRYLVMRFSGEFQGMQFEGMNVTGYDNYKQMYNNLWVDNFGTGFYLSTGTCNPDGSECTDMGFWSDPIHGDYQVRQITRIIDDNTFTMEMYMLEQGKDEFKSMEITYTRK